jgi:hypothetical protein
MDIELFFEIEKNNNVFEIKVNDIYIWERIRFELYKHLEQETGAGKRAKNTERNLKNKFKGVFKYLRNTFKKNPFLSKEKDVLVIGHPRRKNHSGTWWDIYCDPIYEKLDLDHLHLETPYAMEHKSPALTKNIKYLDLVNFFSNLPLPKNFPSLNIVENDKLVIENSEKEILQKLGVEVDLMRFIRTVIQERFLTKWLYEWLLKKIRPKIALVVVSYGKETFIEVCKSLGIPVVEMQHGIIHRGSVGYYFPNNTIKRAFPDYLLTFGDYWKKRAKFPIPQNRIIPVGFPYMDVKKKKYKNIEEEEKILFLSQGPIGKELSLFAEKISKNADLKYEVIYKLHPGEYSRWKEEYPWLIDANIKVIDSDAPPLYELFASSKIQIGVNSTALYEGISFGLRTFVYKVNDEIKNNPLVKDGLAKPITNANELISEIEDRTLYNEMSSIKHDVFKPGSIKNVSKTLNWLIKNGESYIT